MQLRHTAPFAIVAGLFAPSYTHAGFPVSVLVDFPSVIQHAENMAQWGQELDKWREQSENMREQIDQAYTMLDRGGDVASIMKQLQDLGDLGTALDLRLSGGSFTADSFMEMASGEDFKAKLRLGEGTSGANANEFNDLSGTYSGYSGARDLIERNRAAEADILAAAEAALNRAKSDGTVAGQQRALLELERLRLAASIAAANQQATVTDVELAAKQKDVEAEGVYVAGLDSSAQAGLLAEQTEEQDQQAANALIVQQLQPVDLPKRSGGAFWKTVLVDSHDKAMSTAKGISPDSVPARPYSVPARTYSVPARTGEAGASATPSE